MISTTVKPVDCFTFLYKVGRLTLISSARFLVFKSLFRIFLSTICNSLEMKGSRSSSFFRVISSFVSWVLFSSFEGSNKWV